MLVSSKWDLFFKVCSIIQEYKYKDQKDQSCEKLA